MTHRRLLAGLIAVAAAGCGDSGPVRKPVAGRVSLDGRPLASGSIAFVPLDAGTPAEGQIRDGAFRLSQSDGPGLGAYRVEIAAVEPTGKQVRSPDDPTATIEEVRNLIPPTYNVRSQLHVEVKPEGENEFTFGLLSASEKDRTGKVRGANGGQRRPAYED